MRKNMKTQEITRKQPRAPGLGAALRRGFAALTRQRQQPSARDSETLAVNDRVLCVCCSGISPAKYTPPWSRGGSTVFAKFFRM